MFISWAHINLSELLIRCCKLVDCQFPMAFSFCSLFPESFLDLFLKLFWIFSFFFCIFNFEKSFLLFSDYIPFFCYNLLLSHNCKITLWTVCQFHLLYYFYCLLVDFAFFACAFGVISKKIIVKTSNGGFSPIFSSTLRVLTVSHLTFKSLTNFELIFVNVPVCQVTSVMSDTVQPYGP